MAGSWNRVNHFIIEADQMTHPIHCLHSVLPHL